MSSDPNQPAQPPARRAPDPADEPAPPTVRMPAQPAGQDPAAGRMPPGGMRPGQVPSSDQEPPPGQWEEPATRPAPQWQPTPPPAPQWQPTVKEPALDPTVQQPAQGRAAPPQGGAAQSPVPPAQRLQDPRQQRPQWQAPQDTPQQPPQATPQWTPQPPRAGAQWAQQSPQATPQWTPQSPQPPQPGAQWGQAPSPRMRRGQRRRRTRRWVMAVFTVVVLVILLVIGDRVANAITENAFASQFQKQGVPVKPSVDITGFPFLTQLAAKDFNKVDISASNIPVNLPTGGTLSITSVNATINGLHISGYSSSANAKVDHISATAFISFGSLAAAGSLGGTGVTLTQAGPNTVKITAGVAGLSDTEEAQITQTGPQTITIKIVDSGSGGLLGGVLGSIGFNSFSFTLPKVVPASLRITALTLNSQGLTVSAAASNAVFSQ
jgi:LmeA-like phospholipid-binding